MFKSLGFLGFCLLFSYVGFGQSYKNYVDDYRRPKEIPAPKSNPITEKKVELGKKLFFDPRLSGSNWISCATCHNPALGWEDALPTGIGHGMKVLGRHTPTILNLAWGELLFWDGRAESLEEQALGPIGAEGEMNQNLDEAVSELKMMPSYVADFKNVFGEEGISKDTIAKAIATYERTIVSGKSSFDAFIEGDETAISKSAQRGFVLFNEKAKCSSCHSGWRFTDDSFHDVGVKTKDKGRFEILPFETMMHAFKTPTLRNIDQRAPYMHNGSEKTLEEVVELYNLGGRIKRDSISTMITPLGLNSQEKIDLVAFMNTLTGNDEKVTLPVLAP